MVTHPSGYFSFSQTSVFHFSDSVLEKTHNNLINEKDDDDLQTQSCSALFQKEALALRKSAYWLTGLPICRSTGVPDCQEAGFLLENSGIFSSSPLSLSNSHYIIHPVF
jgi:hypothetical protein